MLCNVINVHFLCDVYDVNVYNFYHLVECLLLLGSSDCYVVLYRA